MPSRRSIYPSEPRIAPATRCGTSSPAIAQNDGGHTPADAAQPGLAAGPDLQAPIHPADHLGRSGDDAIVTRHVPLDARPVGHGRSGSSGLRRAGGGPGDDTAKAETSDGTGHDGFPRPLKVSVRDDYNPDHGILDRRRSLAALRPAFVDLATIGIAIEPSSGPRLPQRPIINYGAARLIGLKVPQSLLTAVTN